MKRHFQSFCFGVFVPFFILSLGGCRSARTPATVPSSELTVSSPSTAIAPSTTLPQPPSAAITSAPTARLNVVSVSTGTSAQPAGAEAHTRSDTSQTSGPTPEASKDLCLSCHGPYDKLVAATTNYVAPSGEKITPHYYVPYTSKEAKAIPECSNCHQSHPTPPTAADITAMGKPGVDWCYTTCHHNNDFTPCKKCHNK